MWEDAEKKITKAQLGRAAAALSPGGYRGNKVQIPEADIAGVKRKIRAAYRALGVEDDDIPRWVKESETREFLNDFVSLTEAKFDKGRATVTVIKPGFNATSDRYYPAEVLKRDYGIFEGQKMYADHPTEAEDKERPERSIKDWVATLTEVTVDDSGIVTGVAEIVEPWLMEKLANLRDKDMLSEMGVSINAIGSASKGKIDGKETMVIEKLVAARSVDFVTEPGAGGIVTMYEADRNTDVDLIEITALRERRPDLVKVIEEAVKKELTLEVEKMSEQDDKIKELETENERLTKDNGDMKESIEAAEKAGRIAEAEKLVKAALEEAELPAAAKKRISEKFAESETADGIAEAIQAEKDYIAELSESVKVKDLGPTKEDAEKNHAALTESFKGMGMSDEEAETAAAGR